MAPGCKIMKVMPSKFLCEFVLLQKDLGQLMESRTYAYLCCPPRVSGCTPTLSPRPSRLIMLQMWIPLRNLYSQLWLKALWSLA
ncbi:KIF15 isoform 2 [Pan troglodytes]|uniref:Kinesin family member 15 n=2 Tax=Homininae TaxID=207598 RepID=F8WC33_HUMAN|nr:kinesin family member 15 [Homo sapiens]KAI4029258.1 kinesin family member 15 [Homo sapiens]PNI81075.1 KIF15 isoform 2 [Pan troglodytes]